MRRLLPPLLLVLAACAATAPGSRVAYQGIILDTLGQGTPQLEREEAADPTIRSWVAREGKPDFVLATTPLDVVLIYYTRSLLAHFHRPEPGVASASATLSPLPTSLVEVLPGSMEAGTPTPAPSAAGGCWTTTPGGERCKTCCPGRLPCGTQCTPAGPP